MVAKFEEPVKTQKFVCMYVCHVCMYVQLISYVVICDGVLYVYASITS